MRSTLHLSSHIETCSVLSAQLQPVLNRRPLVSTLRSSRPARATAMTTSMDKSTRRVYSAEELHRLRGASSQPKLRESIEKHDSEDAELVKGMLGPFIPPYSPERLHLCVSGVRLFTTRNSLPPPALCFSHFACCFTSASACFLFYIHPFPAKHKQTWTDDTSRPKLRICSSSNIAADHHPNNLTYPLPTSG